MSLSQHMIGETPKNPFLPSQRAQVATPKRQVNIQQDPSEVSEGSYELAIEALRLRYQARLTTWPIKREKCQTRLNNAKREGKRVAKARRRCRNALIYTIYQVVKIFKLIYYAVSHFWGRYAVE